MEFTDFRIVSFLFLPLLSFMILIFFGNKVNEKSHYIALPIIGLTLLNALYLLIQSLKDHNLSLKPNRAWKEPHKKQ